MIKLPALLFLPLLLNVLTACALPPTAELPPVVAIAQPAATAEMELEAVVAELLAEGLIDQLRSCCAGYLTHVKDDARQCDRSHQWFAKLMILVRC